MKILSLPDFEPNEYLYETHADKGQERWEIFAWAVREIMLSQSGLNDDHMSWRHKDQYEQYMHMAKGSTVPEFSPGGVPVNQVQKEKSPDSLLEESKGDEDIHKRLIPSIKNS